MTERYDRAEKKVTGTDARDLLTEKVIGAAIKVHRELGPGLLESVYETCLMYELNEMGLEVRQQVVLPVVYKRLRLRRGYRIDLLVGNELIIEIKTMDRLMEIHEAQLLTYLRLSGIKKGLVLNFQVPLLKSGIRRKVM